VNPPSEPPIDTVLELMMRLRRHDERAFHALLLRRIWWVDHLMRAVTHLGGAAFSIAVALGLILGAVPGLEAAGAAAAFALASSHAAVQAIKRAVSRPRPELPVGLLALARAPDRFSFPSGHSAASLSVALPVALAMGGLVGWAILVLGLVVGFSRVYLGVHFPGDVLVGWTLALGGLWVGALVGL
jgi:undecaprenyl-diphosphatase